MLTAVDPTVAAARTHIPDLAPQGVVGVWRVEGVIGRGGMGTVYAVVHEQIGKRAAMKVMHRHPGADDSAAQRLLVEARAVNAVTNPHIVDIFDSGTLPDGRAYLVMERLRGKTLGDRMDEGRIPPIEVIDHLLPLCDALAAAHAAGVIHRDIKLDNIFIVEPTATALGEPARETIKLLDWGIASITETAGEAAVQETLIGTPRYIAPERARGDRATPASDVYSLGVMAYELFLEEPPFHAPFAADILRMHLHDPPPPPSEVWPQIPPMLEDLLLEMLAKTAALRPSIARVADVLREVRAGLVRAAEAKADARAAAEAVTAADAIAAVKRRTGEREAVPQLVTVEPSGARIVLAPVATPAVGSGPVRVSSSVPVVIEPEHTPMCSVVLEVPVAREQRRWRWAAVASGMFAVGLTVKLWAPSLTPARGERLALGTPSRSFAPITATIAATQPPAAEVAPAPATPNPSYGTLAPQSVDGAARVATGTAIELPAVTSEAASSRMAPRATATRTATPAARPSRPHPRPGKRPLHFNAVIDPY